MFLIEIMYVQVYQKISLLNLISYLKFDKLTEILQQKVVGRTFILLNLMSL